jgi:hypothetical protein
LPSPFLGPPTSMRKKAPGDRAPSTSLSATGVEALAICFADLLPDRNGAPFSFVAQRASTKQWFSMAPRPRDPYIQFDPLTLRKENHVMVDDATFAAFWMGKDSIRGDKCPFPAGTPKANAWEHGYWSMMAEEEPELRTPMTDEEVRAAWPKTPH